MAIGTFLSSMTGISEESGQFIVVVIFWLVLLAATYFAVTYFIRKKNEFMHKREAEMDFSFNPEQEERSLQSISNLPILRKGHSPEIHNVSSITVNDIYWTVIDYEYFTSSIKGKKSILQTIIWISGRKFPRFTLGPEHFINKIGEVFGFSDINFEEYPVFSSKYLLRGPDEAEIRKTFTPDIIKFFEQIPYNDLVVETDGNNAAFYCTAKRMRPEEIREFIEKISPLILMFTSSMR